MTRRPGSQGRALKGKPLLSLIVLSLIVAITALAFLMIVAYRGFSVILFAPIAALFAVLLTDPSGVPTVYSGLFMERSRSWS